MLLPKLTPEMVEEAVNRIVEAVHPLQIIAFGSRAKGTARPDSDLDLLVVLSQPAASSQIRFDTAVHLHEMLSDISVAKDILVSDAAHLAAQISCLGSVYKEAAQSGTALWSDGTMNTNSVRHVSQ